jgi:hypothetical protein
MKRLASTISLTFAAVLALPMTAIAQTIPRPLNSCAGMYTDDGYQVVCSFHPTTDHDILAVLPDSIHRAGYRSRSADFVYLNIPHPSRDYRDGRRSYAQVDCKHPDHWNRFIDDWRSEVIPAESDAAQRMLNFVCQQAGMN